MKHITIDVIYEIADYTRALPMLRDDALVEEGLKHLSSDLGIALTHPRSAADMVLLAEAFNLAAKTIHNPNCNYYSYKTAAINSAVLMGVEHGWGSDNAFYMFEQSIGTACFHDPHDQINIEWVERWPHDWSGIYRQDHAIRVLLDEEIRAIIADATTPGSVLYGISNDEVDDLIWDAMASDMTLAA